MTGTVRGASTQKVIFPFPLFYEKKPFKNIQLHRILKILLQFSPVLCVQRQEGGRMPAKTINSASTDWMGAARAGVYG